MKNEQANQWDEEMQVRVFGAMPADDYNYKKDVTPNYSADAAQARRLVDKINASGRYRVAVKSGGNSAGAYSVEVRSADDQERLSFIEEAHEAPAICKAIVTADVKL